MLLVFFFLVCVLLFSNFGEEKIRGCSSGKFLISCPGCVLNNSSQSVCLSFYIGNIVSWRVLPEGQSKPRLKTRSGLHLCARGWEHPTVRTAWQWRDLEWKFTAKKHISIMYFGFDCYLQLENSSVGSSIRWIVSERHNFKISSNKIGFLSACIA